jgi:hypothetical protein
MLSGLRKIIDCASDFGNTALIKNQFINTPEFDKVIKIKAKEIKRNKFTRMRRDALKILYTGYNETKYILKLDDEPCFNNWSCECSRFIKWALCHHVVAYRVSKSIKKLY